MNICSGPAKSLAMCENKMRGSCPQYSLKSKKQILVTNLSNFPLLCLYKPCCLINSGRMTSVIKNRALTTNFQGN